MHGIYFAIGFQSKHHTYLHLMESGKAWNEARQIQAPLSINLFNPYSGARH